VGTRDLTLCVDRSNAAAGNRIDAERPQYGSHAERWNQSIASVVVFLVEANSTVLR